MPTAKFTVIGSDELPVEIEIDSYAPFTCGKYGCAGTEFRLYRDAGGFYREESNRCAACLTYAEQYYVPLVTSKDDSVWGYTSCPASDIYTWALLPDNGDEPKQAKPATWVLDDTRRDEALTYARAHGLKE